MTCHYRPARLAMGLMGPKRDAILEQKLRVSGLPSAFANGFGAHNSAVECHLHTVEVVGSNPAVPTILSTT
jgi:hypothetical protein